MLKPYLHIYASKTGKKGSFLLFGVVMVFQIVELTCLADSYNQSKHILGYVWTGGICSAYYTITSE